MEFWQIYRVTKLIMFPHQHFVTINYSCITCGTCMLLYSLQGQNRMTAFSRGFYFIVVGMVAFLIDVAIENGPQDPLYVYHFNLSSPQILTFIRDGLLSMWRSKNSQILWSSPWKTDTILISYLLPFFKCFNSLVSIFSTYRFGIQVN